MKNKHKIIITAIGGASIDGMMCESCLEWHSIQEIGNKNQEEVFSQLCPTQGEVPELGYIYRDKEARRIDLIKDLLRKYDDHTTRDNMGQLTELSKRIHKEFGI